MTDKTTTTGPYCVIEVATAYQRKWQATSEGARQHGWNLLRSGDSIGNKLYVIGVIEVLQRDTPPPPLTAHKITTDEYIDLLGKTGC